MVKNQKNLNLVINLEMVTQMNQVTKNQQINQYLIQVT